MGSVLDFGCFESFQSGGPLPGKEFPGDPGAALGLECVSEQLANGRAFFGDAGDLTNLGEFNFRQIDSNFHAFTLLESDFHSSEVRLLTELIRIFHQSERANSAFELTYQTDPERAPYLMRLST